MSDSDSEFTTLYRLTYFAGLEGTSDFKKGEREVFRHTRYFDRLDLMETHIASLKRRGVKVISQEEWRLVARVKYD